MILLVRGLTLFLLFLGVAQVLSHGNHAQRPRLQVNQVKTTIDSAVDVRASPGVLQKSGEWVEVSWSGVVDPRQGDWIGVYSPGDVRVNETAPIKYMQADDADPNYLATGRGTYRFRLTNMRADYVFHFFRNGINHPTLTASSNAVAFANYNEPLQGRLMLTGRPDEMRVMWTTRDADQPEVRFGTSPGMYNQRARAATSTYKKEQMCGAPATGEGWRDPGLLHSAIMPSLQPDTRYYYIYGDARYGFSKESSFVSAPQPQDNREIRLFAFGDLGKTTQDGSTEHWDSELASINTTTLISKDLDNSPMDLLLHIGDIAYAVGYSAQWDEYHDQVSSISNRVPYMTCIGNHERDFPNSGSLYTGQDSGGECGVAYEARFPMPTPAKDQPWYSFDFGFIHFTFMSTEHDFSRGSKQWAWIEEDLAKVNRTRTPWLVFSGHRPMYIDSQGNSGAAADQPVARALRENVEVLLYKHQVDLALWGHHHSYQRSCPVYNGTCVGSGPAPTHVVIGMAGFSLTTNIEPTKPSWARVVDDTEHGYTRLAITRSRLAMEFVSDVDSRIKDSFVLTK